MPIRVNPYLTRPDRFNWKDLKPDIQDQILEHVEPRYLRQYFRTPEGGFNWAQLKPDLQEKILEHVQDASSHIYGHHCLSHIYASVRIVACAV